MSWEGFECKYAPKEHKKKTKRRQHLKLFQSVKFHGVQLIWSARFSGDDIGQKRPTLAQSQAQPSHDWAVFPTCKSPRYHGHFSNFLLHRATAFWGLTAGARVSAFLYAFP